MNQQEIIEELLMSAPQREFADGSKKPGLFQEELINYGVLKAQLKRLVKDNKIKMGFVNINNTIRNFYHL